MYAKWKKLNHGFPLWMFTVAIPDNLPTAFLPSSYRLPSSFRSFNTMPLSVIATITDFCEFTWALTTTSRTHKPKELSHTVVVPLEYVRAVPEFTSDFKSFQETTSKWWADRTAGIVSSLNFGMCARGLEIKVGFSKPALVTTWSIGTEYAIIKSIVNLHAQASPLKGVLVPIPRAEIGYVDVMQLVGGTDMHVNADSLEIAVDKDYLVVRADKL
jgi:hypothetical protein